MDEAVKEKLTEIRNSLNELDSLRDSAQDYANCAEDEAQSAENYAYEARNSAEYARDKCSEMEEMLSDIRTTYDELVTMLDGEEGSVTKSNDIKSQVERMKQNAQLMRDVHNGHDADHIAKTHNVPAVAVRVLISEVKQPA